MMKKLGLSDLWTLPYPFFLSLFFAPLFCYLLYNTTKVNNGLSHSTPFSLFSLHIPPLQLNVQTWNVHTVMFLLKTNSRQKSIFLFISIVSLIFLSVQLVRYEYDSFSITDIFSWSQDERSSSSPPSFDKPAAAKHEPTPQEKYLTYLPYSRFSNQRSTLLNAALLAKYLNRTLIVPPMFLGNANGWSPAPGLYKVLANMTDSKFQEKCFDDEDNEIVEVPVLQEGQTEVPFGCYNFTSYVMLPWSWATDLNKLTFDEEQGGLGLKIIERSDMSLLALQKQLNINDDEMFLMQDTTVRSV